jgi:hypothetical protein
VVSQHLPFRPLHFTDQNSEYGFLYKNKVLRLWFDSPLDGLVAAGSHLQGCWHCCLVDTLIERVLKASQGCVFRKDSYSSGGSPSLRRCFYAML